MKSTAYGWHFLELASQVSDMKNDHYRQLLAISTIIELLVDKGILSQEEIKEKALQMEAELDRQLLL
ncbi:hypothetical protein [Cohnella abietis]|uniref:Uncharacterized protein n=1 Tax=Cohnella abietis TaxID=2507935 RepID=A0A3T1DF92_9BACL|nr:hypothetical protein [Cohnella abietis]BBI36763.1 hypothetical protein KCTCHS21_61620 [Cohnella abietis]